MADEGEVVSDDQVGQPHVTAQVGHQVQDLGLDRDIKAGGGLIRDHQAGLQGQGAGDADAAGLAARQLVRVAVGDGGGQAHGGQKVAGGAGGIGQGLAVDAEGFGDQAAHGQPGGKRGGRVLEHHRGVAAEAGEVGDRLAVEQDAARGHRLQPHHGAGEGGLAGPAFPDQRQAFPAPDRQRDVLQDRQARAGEEAAERQVDGQVLKVQNRSAQSGQITIIKRNQVVSCGR